MMFLASRCLALAVIVTLSSVSGFSFPNQVKTRPTETVRFASPDDANLEKEVSRRVALVTAAAMATGVVVGVPAAAYAANVPTQRSIGGSTIKDAIRLAKLELQVADLEKKNLSTVNSDGAPDKHIPQVSVEPAKSNTNGSSGSLLFNVKVTVPHVMDAEKPHYIQFVWLKDMKKGNVVAVKAFQASTDDTTPPTLMAVNLKAGMKVKPLLFCNLHGLWEGETLRL
jgi:desulfoferrodoxin (superoxide reductase-like protein)